MHVMRRDVRDGYVASSESSAVVRSTVFPGPTRRIGENVTPAKSKQKSSLGAAAFRYGWITN